MVGFPGRILTFCFLHTVTIGMLQISRICYSLVCGMMKKKIMIVLFVADVIYLWKRGQILTKSTNYSNLSTRVLFDPQLEFVYLALARELIKVHKVQWLDQICCSGGWSVIGCPFDTTDLIFICSGIYHISQCQAL